MALIRMFDQIHRISIRVIQQGDPTGTDKAA